MDKLKIAIIQAGTDAANDELVRRVCEDSALLELCTPDRRAASATNGTADASVIFPAAEPVECPADAVEIVVTETARFMPLAGEPTAEDIAKFRDILERDFDLRSPRIAILQETAVHNPDLASQVTAEQGINTYGPYTAEQLLAEDKACHFDGIISADKTLPQRIIKELALEAPVRYFAGRDSVVTALFQPVRIDGEEEGLADISALTHPFYTAIDVVRNRALYDEARQNPLPKLYRDKREDKRKDNAPQANNNKEDNEQA